MIPGLYEVIQYTLSLSLSLSLLRMEAQLNSLRASATRLTGKHWAAPCASSLLTGPRARAEKHLMY